MAKKTRKQAADDLLGFLFTDPDVRKAASKVVRQAFTSFNEVNKEIEQEDELEWAYKTLGVRADAETEAIEAVYKSLAKKYHPDSGGDEKHMTQINKAHDAILEKRAKS